jgi:hypothetical protein
MNITQVKHWSKTVNNEVVDHVTISYQENGSDVTKHEFGNNSTAAPEFYECFDKMAEYVCKICSIDEKYVSAISVREVKIAPSEDKEGDDNTVYSFTSGFKAGLATATLKVSVNNKYVPENFDDAIQDLINEAEEYISGKRAQVEMDFEPSEEAESEQPEDDFSNDPIDYEEDEEEQDGEE